MPSKRSIRYRVVKRSSTVLRRLLYRPAFRWAPNNTKWLYILFLVVIPLGYSATVLVARLQTQYYLFTGPRGGTHHVLGPRLTETLYRPDKLERLLHLHLLKQVACGLLGRGLRWALFRYG